MTPEPARERDVVDELSDLSSRLRSAFGLTTARDGKITDEAKAEITRLRELLEAKAPEIETCQVPGCENLTDRGICDDCDQWITDQTKAPASSELIYDTCLGVKVGSLSVEKAVARLTAVECYCGFKIKPGNFYVVKARWAEHALASLPTPATDKMLVEAARALLAKVDADSAVRWKFVNERECLRQALSSRQGRAG